MPMNDQIDEIRAELEREKIARDVLGVADIADEMEIKKKYWLLAMENHPDLHPYDRERENRFKFFRNGNITNKGQDGIYNEGGYFKWWKMAFF